MNPAEIAIRINGKLVRVPRGVSVAAAVMIAGEPGFRRSVSGEPRGPLCGMGICFECRVTVDGRPNVRSCLTEVAEGTAVETE
jgi:sarcosine oxidase subunit alpha